jgi:integration host factor subunit beta
MTRNRTFGSSSKLLTVDRLGPYYAPARPPWALLGERMTKADLVEKVTAQIARTAGPLISKKDCARVVDSFLDAVKAALAEQHNIEIRGFGTFKIRQRKTRMARNPRTGDPVEVAARPVPVFKPSKELRALVAHEEYTPDESEMDDDE